ENVPLICTSPQRDACQIFRTVFKPSVIEI
ncbi:MAG: hypothetical protein ACI9FD_005053, partial [Gammaproteobacteria bacterium]